MPPPALPPELLEEIFLRLPPGEPACLVRASLASRLWLALLTGARFRALYRDHHGAPPMLGFIYSCNVLEEEEEENNNLPRFVATTKFGVRVPAVEDWSGWHKDYAAWDCRHGRVLFSNNHVIPMPLVVWDPMTGRRRLMYAPEDYDSSGAAVLCNLATTGGGCDHCACPFQVVFVGLYNGDGGCVAFAHVSLPDVGNKWSNPCPALHLAIEDAFIVDRPPVLVQDALYFMLTYEYHDDNAGDDNIAILKYDLGSNCLSLVDAPPKTGLAGDIVIMAMEDASLGFVDVDRLTLKLWSRQMGSSGVMTWTQRRIVNLEELLLIQNLKQTIRLIGSVESSDIIFVTTDLGNYEINLKSLQWKELWQRKKYRSLFPYMSFYSPPERVSLSDAAH